MKDLCDVNIITYGDVINEFEEKMVNLNVGLINAIFVKPMYYDLLKSLSNKKVIIVEEVMKIGSLAHLIMK